MEKKKLTLSISNTKKTIRSIEEAKLQSKNSVIIEKKQGKFGMVTANGWFLTKHGAGIFSSSPFLGEWNQVIDSSSFQKEIDNQEHPEFIEEANGKGTVETYTVINSREGPTKAIIIGRLENGKRFVANTKKDDNLLNKMMQNEMLNTKGTIKFENSRNIFQPD